jgi:multiple sugar transport system permease protein
MNEEFVLAFVLMSRTYSRAVNPMSVSRSRRWFALLRTVAVLFILVFYLFPFWWVVTTSFRLEAEEGVQPVVLFPRPLHLDNYEAIVLHNDRDVMTGLRNSLVAATATTFVCILLGSLAGYAYARLSFPGKGFSLGLMLATWMIPWLIVLIPLWAILYEIGLVDTIAGLVIGFSSGFLPVSTWIMLGHFKSLPEELEDSARIDGCSRVGALFRIILPISTPALMATGAFAFISSMSEFTFSLLMTTTMNSKTLPLVLASLASKFVTEKTLMATGSIIAVFIPVVLAMIFQRYLIAGLSAGAVKG